MITRTSHGSEISIENTTIKAVAPAAICSEPSERDKAIWRAALTLAHNMCVQTSNRINDDDGSLEVVHALSDEAKRIRGWMEPTDEQLVEIFAEAGVPNNKTCNGGTPAQ